MLNKLIPALVFGVSALFVMPAAMAADTLFQGYVYDSPYASYPKAKGYYDCTEQMGIKALCLDNVEFIGHKFSAALTFIDDKLNMVSLISIFNKALYSHALEELGKSFSLSAMSDASAQLDMFKLAASTSGPAYGAKVKAFEAAALQSGSLTYSYVDPEERKKSYRDMDAFFADAPDNFRAVELLVIGQTAETPLLIRFSFPKLDANKALAGMKK
jgi:hypothetical protein